ncbi:hypothetical protein [Aquitalea magnusonii]|uniref:Uncharacterized protein n=1 Tax=Aquitalea magnusonii TaxID=332411 RepID=A0A318JIU6_9NEIS|nr:hypothetical protein [Aquitalea magnusonii]PXX49016.1 hypothetical protein DFR38_10552 [Aquitalea magnusonii]
MGKINWLKEEVITGDIGEALAAELKQRGHPRAFFWPAIIRFG